MDTEQFKTKWQDAARNLFTILIRPHIDPETAKPNCHSVEQRNEWCEYCSYSEDCEPPADEATGSPESDTETPTKGTDNP